jgi:hypothetical protein
MKSSIRLGAPGRPAFLLQPALVTVCFLTAFGWVTSSCHADTIDEYTWTFLPPPGPLEGTGIDTARGSWTPITPPAPDFTATGTLFINSSNPDVAASGSVFTWDGGALTSASFEGFTVHPGSHPTVEGLFYLLPGFKTPSAQIMPASDFFSSVPSDAQVVAWSSGGESSQFFRVLYGEWDLVSSTTAPEGGSTGVLFACALAVLSAGARVAKRHG